MNTIFIINNYKRYHRQGRNVRVHLRGGRGGGAHLPRKTVNISHNLAFGRRKKIWNTKSFRGRQKGNKGRQIKTLTLYSDPNSNQNPNPNPNPKPNEKLNVSPVATDQRPTNLSVYSLCNCTISYLNFNQICN